MMKFIMFMEDKDLENKTPSKMARLAWPKAKYGAIIAVIIIIVVNICLLYTSPSPRDLSTSRMPSSA